LPCLSGETAPPAQTAPRHLTFPSDPSFIFGFVAGFTVKTEAVVLRSIRYGEADRILHLYSETHGRIGAIAKGARKPRSRFGGRLEPFFRLDLILHEGRSDLMTVTSAATVDGYPRLRSSGAALTAGARACDAVLRLLDSAEANPPAYNLLCRYLSLLDDPAEARAAELTTALSFRLKLALAAGFAPELASCARCGEAEHLAGFSGAAGGVDCGGCEGGSFPLSEEAHRFMVDSLAKPLNEAPAAEPMPLRQVERAVGETLEHHAHVQLRAAA
jgi:DNA repair protein RecO (recombination protein O)